MTRETSHSRLLATKPVHGEPGYIEFPGESGDYLSIAHDASLNTAADVSAIVHLLPVDITPAAEQTFYGKFTTSGGQRSWRLSWMPAGHLRFTVSPDGAAAISLTSTVIVDAARLGLYGCLVAAAYDADNGASQKAVSFWTLPVNDPNVWVPAIPLDDPAWQPLGLTVVNAGAAAPFASTADLTVSGHTAGASGPFAGRVYYASLRTAIGDNVETSEGVFHRRPASASEQATIHARVDVVDAAAVTFPTSQGPARTVTVNRSGDPATTLIPAVGRGAPVGIDDWRLVIERLNGSGAVWGAFKWGTVDAETGLMPKWGALGWEDITDSCDGWSSNRGADEPNGRPRVGDVELTVQNDMDEFDPWVHYPDVRPGTVIRAGYVSLSDSRADGWLPRWTGLVEDWPVEYHGVGAMSRCVVTIAETLSSLATLDDNATSLQGTGETFQARVERLADAANWKFGSRVDFGPFSAPDATMQGTTMAQNRLAELYVTADSATNSTFSIYRGIVRSDVTGALLITNTAAHRGTTSRLRAFSYFELFGFEFPCIVLSRDPDGDENPPLVHVDYVADSPTSANNLDGLWNDHRYARVGGTQQVVRHAVSIGRFEKAVTRSRGDLVCQTDAEALRCARHDNDLEARAVLRIEGIDIELAADRPLAFLPVMAADVGDSLWVFPPAATGFAGSAVGRIRSISELCVPGAGTVESVVTFTIDFYSFTDMPGVQLAPAP